MNLLSFISIITFLENIQKELCWVFYEQNLYYFINSIVVFIELIYA